MVRFAFDMVYLLTYLLGITLVSIALVFLVMKIAQEGLNSPFLYGDIMKAAMGLLLWSISIQSGVNLGVLQIV